MYKNKESQLAYQRKYRIKNKSRVRLYQRTYYKNNKEKYKVYRKNVVVSRKKNWEKNKALWMTIIVNKHMHVCSVCGYSKCFLAIDFHHTDSTIKRYNIAEILRTHPTEEKIAELDKCVALCSNCHRELHSEFLEVV